MQIWIYLQKLYPDTCMSLYHNGYRISWLVEDLLVSEKGLCSLELVIEWVSWLII
jgi:hypothetical protein